MSSIQRNTKAACKATPTPDLPAKALKLNGAVKCELWHLICNFETAWCVFLKKDRKGKRNNKTKQKSVVCGRTSAVSAWAHATRHRFLKSTLIRSDMYRQITLNQEGNSLLQKRSVSAHAPFTGGPRPSCG